MLAAKTSSSRTSSALNQDAAATAKPADDFHDSGRDEKWREELAEMRRRNTEGRSTRITERLGTQVTDLWREMKKKQQADPSVSSRLAHRLGAPKTTGSVEGEEKSVAKSTEGSAKPRLAHRLGALKTTELEEGGAEAETAAKRSHESHTASNDRPAVEAAVSAAESAKRAARAARFGTKALLPENNAADTVQLEFKVPTQVEVLAAFRDKMMSVGLTFDKVAPVMA